MEPNNKKNTVFLFLLVAAVVIYSLSGNSIGIHLNFGDEALTVSASDLDWTVPYDQITGLELMDLPDVGTMTDGIDRKNLQCGTWQNEAWDTYTLCINPKLSQCIVLTRRDGSIFVLNYENDESTAELCNMFTELLISKNLLTP